MAKKQLFITTLLAAAPGLLAAMFYGVVSGSMSFMNKVVLTTFQYKHVDVLMLAQIVLTSVVLEICRRLNLCDIPPWTIQRAKTFLIPSICFAIHTTLALAALGDLSIPMYNVLRRLLPLANLIVAHFVLKKTPAMPIVASVVFIVSGCVVAGIGDLQFNAMAYSNALSSVVAQAIYLTYIQKTGIESNASALSVLHLNSINCIPFLLAYTMYSGNLIATSHFERRTDTAFLAAFILDIAFGCILNYSLFLCATMNSALTTSLVGVIKSVLTTAIGFFTFGGVAATFLTISGVTLNTFGGLLYAYAKYQQKRNVMKQMDMVLPSHEKHRHDVSRNDKVQERSEEELLIDPAKDPMTSQEP